MARRQADIFEFDGLPACVPPDLIPWAESDPYSCARGSAPRHRRSGAPSSRARRRPPGTRTAAPGGVPPARRRRARGPVPGRPPAERRHGAVWRDLAVAHAAVEVEDAVTVHWRSSRRREGTDGSPTGERQSQGPRPSASGALAPRARQRPGQATDVCVGHREEGEAGEREASPPPGFNGERSQDSRGSREDSGEDQEHAGCGRTAGANAVIGRESVATCAATHGGEGNLQRARRGRPADVELPRTRRRGKMGPCPRIRWVRSSSSPQGNGRRSPSRSGRASATRSASRRSRR